MANELSPAEKAAREASEHRQAIIAFLAVAVFLAVCVALVVMVGPHMLGYIGIFMTVLTFIALLGFTTAR